jgi:hypothetical protein
MTALILSQNNVPTPEYKTLQQMQLMLELGINKEVIATLLEIANFSIHHVRWFVAPIIVYKSSWNETIPHWLITACYQERLEQIYLEHYNNKMEQYATKSEILAYLYPLSLEMPMTSNWANLYLWLGNEVMTKFNRLKNGQKFWDVIGGYPVQYSEVQHNFSQIAADIRRSCVAEGKQRGWGKKQRSSKGDRRICHVPNSSTFPNQTNSNSSVKQLSLF